MLLQQFTHAIPLHTNLKASLKKKRHNFLILNALSAVYQSVNELLICHYNFSILIPTPFLTHSSPKPCYRTHNHYRIYNQKIYDLHQACRFCDHQDCQICAHVGMLQWPKMSNCYCELWLCPSGKSKMFSEDISFQGNLHAPKQARLSNIFRRFLPHHDAVDALGDVVGDARN